MKPPRWISLIVLIASSVLNASAQNPYQDAALRKAAQEGLVREVNDLIRNSADVNARDKKGRTALHWAAPARDNPLMIHVLIANGADDRRQSGESWDSQSIA